MHHLIFSSVLQEDSFTDGSDQKHQLSPPTQLSSESSSSPDEFGSDQPLLHHCHHQVCLLHHQICHTCCHTLFRCCVNLCTLVFNLHWSVCFLTIGLYYQFVLLLIQLGIDKNNQFIRSVYCCTELACTLLCT